MTRFQFVADHQHAYEVKRPSELVQVERSSFYAWQAAAPARRARVAADAQLAERIRAVHQEDNTMGAPRITAELNDGVSESERVNHKRVARVMRQDGIRGYRRRRKVRTTIPDQAEQKVPDLIKRDFTAQTPNQRYVGDITYLPIADGSNLYLATVIDCHSRRLVGWAVADHMRTELVEDALKAAVATRGSLAGAIFQSDHGSVYTSKDFAKRCAELGVTQSMGAVGTSADNSLAEAFNATFKRGVTINLPADPQTCEPQDSDGVARANDAFDALAWLIWPTDGLDELREVGAFRILSVESEAVAASIDRGKAAWTVIVKLTDVDQLRRLAVQANPAQAQLIAESLAVAWQNAADPFAPLHSIPGIRGQPGETTLEQLPARTTKRR